MSVLQFNVVSLYPAFKNQVVQGPAFSSPGSKLRRAVRAFGVSALIMGGLVLVACANSSAQKVEFPVAKDNETLIVVGKFGGDTRGQPGSGVQSRIIEGIENELTAGRVIARVAAWPEEIPDNEVAREKSKARLVVSGVRQTDRLIVRVGLADPVIKLDDQSYRLLVARPNQNQVTLDPASANDLRALALFVVMQLYLDDGRVSEARTALASASTLGVAQADTRRVFEYYADLIGQLPGNR
jgi:hypothetical protein